MIGQSELLGQIRARVEDFPRFAVIAGARGSGKFQVAQYIAEQLGTTTVSVDKSVESIRDFIATVNKTAVKMVYVFRRAEDFSTQAINALLKTLEEPPEGVYIIFTTRNEYALLETIRSRAQVFHMQAYSKAELQEFNNGKAVPDFCKTPYDVLKYEQVSGLEDFADLVADNVCNVTLVNALRIADRVDVDGTDPSKFDLFLFFEAFKEACRKRLLSRSVPADTCVVWMGITATYQHDASRAGANRKMLFDMWLFELRGDL